MLALSGICTGVICIEKALKGTEIIFTVFVLTRFYCTRFDVIAYKFSSPHSYYFHTPWSSRISNSSNNKLL